jgi:drug/metabolite transporter (DMT)-like permease
MTATRLSPTQGRLCIVLAAVLWSLGGALTKILREPTPLGLHEPHLDYLLIATYRVLFAGLVFVPFLRPKDITFSLWMIFTALSFALMNATYISAVALGPAASAILLQNSAALWMYLVGVFCLGEKASLRTSIALFVGLGGIAIIVIGGWHDARVTPTALALASSVFFACIMIGLRLLRGHSSFWVTVLNHLTGALVLAPLVWHLPWPSWAQMGTLFVFGALQLGLPYWLMARGLSVISTQEAGMLTLVEPILNPLWAYLVSPGTETPSFHTLLGGAFVLTALLYRYWPTPPGRPHDRDSHHDPCPNADHRDSPDG